MSVTSGFYNSINHDRIYDAKQVSQLFDGLITDGVYRTIGNAFVVTVNSGMRLNVDSGRAWFNHTWLLNDTVFNVEIPTAHPAYPRYDAVIIRIDSDARENSITVKSGDAALEPIKPVMSKGPEVYEYPLAYVLVETGTTEISQSVIEQRIGSDECPFVAGVVQGVSIENLLKNWKDEFELLMFQLNEQISQAASQTLVDKSVTYEKLADDAVWLGFSDITVQPDEFVEDQTYEEYPYKADIALAGVKESMFPEVVFSYESLNANYFAPICKCFDNGISVFAFNKPSDVVKIETIACWRRKGA